MFFDKIFESPAMQKMQEFGGKVQSNKAISCISGGMMSTLSIIMAGAVFSIIATLLNITGLVQTTDAVYQWLEAPYNMTIGIMSVIIAFSVGYQYTKALGMHGELANGIVTMVLFLMVCAPVQTLTLKDGSTVSALSTTYLGGSGMFAALIIPLVSVRIIKLCQDHSVMLKMPDSVPQYLSDAFSAAIPLVINIVLWCGINTLCENMLNTQLPGAIMGLLSVPLSGLTSLPGMFVIAFVGLLCWCLGIHGTGVIMIVLMPVYMQYFATNAALVAAGKAAVFQPVCLYFLAQSAGGSGNMLPLAVLCTRCKSEQLKAMGKVGLVPAAFNVSEPMVFGVPVMYNPLIALPFILNTLLSMLAIYFGFKVGFFQPETIMVMTAMPIFLANYVTSMAWQNVFIVVVCFIIGIICYAPFVKMYDKQLCHQEAERKVEAEGATA